MIHKGIQRNDWKGKERKFKEMIGKEGKGKERVGKACKVSKIKGNARAEKVERFLLIVFPVCNR